MGPAGRRVSRTAVLHSCGRVGRRDSRPDDQKVGRPAGLRAGGPAFRWARRSAVHENAGPAVQGKRRPGGLQDGRMAS